MTIWNSLIPQPRSVEERAGSIDLSHPLTLHSGDAEPPPEGWIERINEAARRLLGRSVPLVSPTAAGGPSLEITAERELGDGYRLVVESDRIRIAAGTLAGRSAAMATLVQAMLLAGDGETAGADPTADGSARVTAVRVTDAPTHEWRGFMLDVARHFMPITSLRQVVDVLWLLRLNRFHLHLTDDQGWRLPVPEYPRLVEIGAWRPAGTSDNQRIGGAYTQQELRDLDAECARLGITVVPEVDLPGHASAAFSAYPELSCFGGDWAVETRWGIFPSVMCASRDGVDRFLDAVYATIADTFSGDYVHIGGDEVPPEPWRDCPQCRALDDPYQTIVRRMADAIVARGRRPVVWDEASALDLPGETIVVNWRGPEGSRNALRRGYDLVLAPERQAAYLDHKHRDSDLEPGRLGVCTVRDAAAFAPLRYAQDNAVLTSAGTDAGSPAGRILGGQANLWTEGVTSHRAVEYMAFVRLAAVAQGLWSGAPAVDGSDGIDRIRRFRRVLIHRGYNAYPGDLE